MNGAITRPVENEKSWILLYLLLVFDENVSLALLHFVDFIICVRRCHILIK